MQGRQWVEKIETTSVRGRTDSKRGGQIGETLASVGEGVDLRWRDTQNHPDQISQSANRCCGFRLISSPDPR